MRGKVTADAYSGWRRVDFTMRGDVIRACVNLRCATMTGRWRVPASLQPIRAEQIGYWWFCCYLIRNRPSSDSDAPPRHYSPLGLNKLVIGDFVVTRYGIVLRPIVTRDVSPPCWAGAWGECERWTLYESEWGRVWGVMWGCVVCEVSPFGA